MHVGYLPSGHAVVMGRYQGYELYAKHFDATWTLQNTHQLATVNQVDHIYYSTVKALPTGNYIASWREAVGSTSAHTLKYSIQSPSASTLNPAVTLTSGTGLTEYEFVVHQDGSGMMATWLSGSGSSRTISLQQFNNTGTATSTIQTLSKPNAFAVELKPTTTPESAYVMTFYDGATAPYNFKAQLIGLNGAALSNELTISNTSNTSMVPTDALPQNNITSLSTDLWKITYVDQNATGTYPTAVKVSTSPISGLSEDTWRMIGDMENTKN